MRTAPVAATELGIMADPLSLLRDAIIGGRPAELDGDVLVIDGVRAPRKTLTNYKNRTDGSFYTLEAVWFLWQKRDLPHNSYVGEAFAARMPFVSHLDRTDLLNYIAGETASSAQLDPSFQGDEAWLALRCTWPAPRRARLRWP